MEVVSVARDTVAVEKDRRRSHQRFELNRAWLQVCLLSPRLRWYPSRLVLRSHGTDVELGGFLNEDERRRLAGELRSALRERAGEL